MQKHYIVSLVTLGVALLTLVVSGFMAYDANQAKLIVCPTSYLAVTPKTVVTPTATPSAAVKVKLPVAK